VKSFPQPSTHNPIGYSSTTEWSSTESHIFYDKESLYETLTDVNTTESVLYTYNYVTLFIS